MMKMTTSIRPLSVQFTAPRRSFAPRAATTGCSMTAGAGMECALFIEHPVLADAHLDQGDDQDDNEDGDGHRRGVAHPELAEAGLVDLLHDGDRAAQRTAVGHDVH